MARKAPSLPKTAIPDGGPGHLPADAPAPADGPPASTPPRTKGRQRAPVADAEATRVTLEDVAAAAGVSSSTVSRILNGTAVVSGDKSAAVQAAITRLGFVPNPVARGLAGGRTFSVGVLTQSLDSPFYGVALRGIEDEFGRVGYSPLFVSGHWNAAEEARCIEVLRSRRVDGLIVLTGRLSDAALRQEAQSLPVVVTGRSLAAPQLHALNFDNFEGARLATHHLLMLGHRRIAFIAGDPLHPDATDRLRGYRAALEAAGVAFEPALVMPGQYHEESGRQAVERLLHGGQPFTAIFAANDQMAFGAMLALYRRGRRVPQDVSLVGFDDLAGATYSLPPLTTVQQPVYELGRLAAASMLQLLAGETPRGQMPGPRLIVRDSTRPLPTA
jgi:LacI family transcriptional regulator